MSNRAPLTARAGLCCLSAATLLLEVALTRILSVTLWYHYAFMVVSTALFGFGVAGVALALHRGGRPPTARTVAVAASLTPIGFVGGYWAFNHLPFEPLSLGAEPLQWLILPLAYTAVTIPFFCSGLTISALLTRHARSVHGLYFFDLLGAGTGALSVAWLLPLLGGSGTVAAAALLAAGAAVLLSIEASRRWTLAAAATGALLLPLASNTDRWLPVRVSDSKVTVTGTPLAQIFANPRLNLFTAWNNLSRVDVVELDRQRLIFIDAGTAVTRMAHPAAPIASLGRTDDEEAFFFQLFSAPRVLVVGSGGGREVLLALRNGARKVTGVEINPAINELVARRMADFTGHLYQDPRVEAVTDEARGFLRRSSERYDVIYCPHTISNAALATGSLSLAENHLLTLEAFDDFRRHLSPDGVLVITRPEAQLPRLLATIRQAFDATPGEPIGSRVMAWRQPARRTSFYAGVAVRARPFTVTETAAFARVLSRQGLEPLYLPPADRREPYRGLLEAADPRSVPIPWPAILEPATDDQPFFNRRVPLSRLRLADLSGVFAGESDARMALEDRPVAEASIVVLLIETAALAMALIVLPLALTRRRAVRGPGRVTTIGVFALLGLAYIVVEIGLIQRFTLYLGRPMVVFSTVLGTLLVCSGIGSTLARRLRARPAVLWSAAAAALSAAVICLLGRPLLDATLAWPTTGRILVTVTTLIPPGLFMGMPFPLLVRRLEESDPEQIPWAWGLNSVASVIGSIGAVLLGMTSGFTTVLWCGVVTYVAVAWVGHRPVTTEIGSAPRCPS